MNATEQLVLGCVYMWLIIKAYVYKLDNALATASQI